jgi:hypothetical protein
MNLYSVIHTHRHGTDSILIRSEDDLTTGWFCQSADDIPEEVMTIAEKAGIEFDPEKEETLEISKTDFIDIKL